MIEHFIRNIIREHFNGREMIFGEVDSNDYSCAVWFRLKDNDAENKVPVYHINRSSEIDIYEHSKTISFIKQPDDESNIPQNPDSKGGGSK